MSGHEHQDFPEYADVPGWPYECHRSGIIINRIGKRHEPRLLTYNRRGYARVSLFRDGTHTNFSVHILMMMAFKLSEYQEGKEHKPQAKNVDHIVAANWKMGEMQNNSIENLRMATWREQALNRNNTNKSGRMVPVDQFDLQGTFIKTHASLKQAANDLGIFMQHISLCITGHSDNYKDFIFRYHRKITDDDLPGEIFKKVLNTYWVSNMGRVKRERPRKFKGDNLLFENTKSSNELHTSACGYPEFCDTRNRRLHTVVAELFVPKPPNWANNWVVNHIDGDKMNAAATNLEWCTECHNMQEAHRLGLINTHKVAVQQIGENGEVLQEFESQTAAEKANIGVTQWGISACLRGKQDRCGGFGWKRVVRG